MKTLIQHFLFLFIVMSSSLFSQEKPKHDMYEYDSLFLEISDQRVGLLGDEIKKVDNPFVMLLKETMQQDGNKTITSHEIVYNLYAILGKKVKINDEWYGLNDKLGYYTISKIKQNSVLISSTSETKELFIRKQYAKNIKFSSK